MLWFEGHHKLLGSSATCARCPLGRHRMVLTVYDLKNKMITFNGGVDESLSARWDALHVLLRDQPEPCWGEADVHKAGAPVQEKPLAWPCSSPVRPGQALVADI